ncbi:hypothetical protein DC31_05735 [Microbacterium sp. CH12i]|uniref:hypothetical protein n=1 Tax=Microbacterium sp. CH12i TaxID=1479651 RepID=UPI0004611C00|nr:hypothetical protein [Microbacterium sp. CH12i]KDA04643.1 hypothetical protein DC31_05735 [Microbacterium sp. CH12i]
MSTLDLLDDSFPHGTPTGHRKGCRTAACPAVIPCRTVYTRYVGDFTFARRLDAGMSLTEILEQDAAARTRARQHDRTTTATAPPKKRKPAATKHPRTPKTPPPAAQSQADRAPAATPPPAPRTHPGYTWLTHARNNTTLSGDKLAQRLRDLDAYEVELDRHIDELARWRSTRVDLRQQLAAAVKRLATATIASSTGLSVGGAIERALQEATERHQAVTAELEASTNSRPAPPAKPRALRPSKPSKPRQLRPHGTNACRARGCDRPECIEAGRNYHREWMEQRKQQQIPAEYHGTAYGYQLGCKNREHCPGQISCSDASLAEERRRRREAGIAEQPPRVPAEPIRTHTRALMDSGMTVLKIAEEANVSKTGVKILLYGRSGARKGELPREIEAAKAQRILALQPLTALENTA